MHYLMDCLMVMGFAIVRFYFAALPQNNIGRLIVRASILALYGIGAIAYLATQ